MEVQVKMIEKSENLKVEMPEAVGGDEFIEVFDSAHADRKTLKVFVDT